MYHYSIQQQQQQGSVPVSVHAPYSSSTPSSYSGYNSGYSSMQPPASGWSSSAGTGQMQSSSGGSGQATMAYTSGSIPLPHAPAGEAELIAVGTFTVHSYGIFTITGLLCGFEWSQMM
jgi:hypothetical protein